MGVLRSCASWHTAALSVFLYPKRIFKYVFHLKVFAIFYCHIMCIVQMLPSSRICSLNKYLLMVIDGPLCGKHCACPGTQMYRVRPCALKGLAKLPKGKKKRKM